jgi:hypothetical protein
VSRVPEWQTKVWVIGREIRSAILKAKDELLFVRELAEFPGDDSRSKVQEGDFDYATRF